ncbi:MAG: SMP-30/gluconolactonase/LRE family protein, partial [Planctomycetales bacterium]|nr:SMP-30/gluconolactonase/LRE family protein [Planctomycetales bacterium]
SAVLFGLGQAAACGAAEHPPTDDLPAADQVRPSLHATGLELPAGLAFDREGNLYLSNYRQSGIVGRITPEGKASVLCAVDKLAPRERGPAVLGGLTIDSEGRILVVDSGQGRLLRVAADGQRATVLADRFDGQHFLNLCDVAVDRRGNIYFSDSGIAASPTHSADASNPSESGAVYQFDIRRNQVVRLASGLSQPRGLAVSPDQTRLCIAEAGQHRIIAIELHAERDSDEPIVLHTFAAPPESNSQVATSDSAPHGLKFDAEGRLYATMPGSGKIAVLSRDGATLLRQFPSGGQVPVDCHFHHRSLYVTIREKEAVFRLPLGTTGFSYNAQ